MAQRRQASYAPVPGTSLGNEQADQLLAEKERFRQADANKSTQDAAKIAASTVARSGGYVPVGATSGHQSAANVANIARSVAAANNGGHMAPNTPIMPPSYTPGGAKDPAQVAADAKALTDFKAGDPRNAPNPAADAVAGAAGTGKTVTTPYGTASSTTSKAAPVLDKTADQSTGPKNVPAKDYALQQGKNGGLVPSADATAELQKSHPQVFVPGSPENQEFVKQWGDKTKDMKAGDQFNGHTDVATNAVESATPVDKRDAAPVAAAKVNETAAPQIPTAQAAGQAVRAIPSAIGSAANAVGGALSGARDAVAKTVGGFVGGLTGDAQSGQTAQGVAQAALHPLDTAGAVAGAALAPLKPTYDAMSKDATDYSTGVANRTLGPIRDAASMVGSVNKNITQPITQGVASASKAINNAGGASGVAQAINGQPSYDPRTAGQSTGQVAAAYVPASIHADIHAATVKANNQAAQNAHDAVNDAGLPDSALPAPPPVQPPSTANIPPPPSAPATQDTTSY